MQAGAVIENDRVLGGHVGSILLQDC